MLPMAILLLTFRLLMCKLYSAPSNAGGGVGDRETENALMHSSTHVYMHTYVCTYVGGLR